MISGVQTLPARVRPADISRRAGLALSLLIGAVAISFAYSLLSDQHTGDTAASEPALAVSAHTPSSALTTGQIAADTRSDSPAWQITAESRRSAAIESRGLDHAQPFQPHSPEHTSPEHTSTVAGRTPSADRAAESPAQAAAAHDDLASNKPALSGRAAEPLAPRADDVLHITNVGDRIIATRGAEGPRATAIPERSTGYSKSATSTYGSNESADDNQDNAGAVEPRPDYEDVYPGCPRVLPQGTDEKMALERQQLYGCLYHESCATPVDDEPPYCTWHLIKML